MAKQIIKNIFSYEEFELFKMLSSKITEKIVFMFC